MAKEREFYCLTFRDYKEFCDNLTCPGHKPPLQINVEKETGTKFYTMNRLQLNEFWQCCLRDQQAFCSLICTESCKICKWVKAVYYELRDNFFFDFDRSRDEQPILWNVFSSLLDKKMLPCLVEIQTIKRA